MTFRTRVTGAALGTVLVIAGLLGLFLSDADNFLGGFYCGVAIAGGLALVLVMAFFGGEA